MPIKSINEAAWPEIIKVQAEAYSQIVPESLEVLKSKWLHSPDTCFVYEKAGKVTGYLLAHSWNSETPPKLYQTLPLATAGSILFLHDLAISHLATGDGIGSQMVAHLIHIAESIGFQQIHLVSIQQSTAFWQKFGFHSVTNREISTSYGEGAQLMSRVLYRKNGN